MLKRILQSGSHAEPGRYPLSIYVNLCIVKVLCKILNSDVHKLSYIVYQWRILDFICEGGGG